MTRSWSTVWEWWRDPLKSFPRGKRVKCHPNLCQFANSWSEKDSTEGCFNDKIPTAIWWRNEMARTGRRSGWPLRIHCRHMPGHAEPKAQAFRAATTISSTLIIIKPSSAVFTNPTKGRIFLRICKNRERHMLPRGSRRHMNKDWVGWGGIN